VVNAGSDSVSVFRVSGTSLSRTDVQPIGANRPISVTARGTLVYVLHTGNGGGVRGFRRDSSGRLAPIAGSARPLSGNGVVPAQVGITRDGAQVIVTERATDKLTRYRVNANGSLQAPVTTSSAGPEPFGFDFAPDGTMIVSEAANHVEDASTVSSYRFNSGGTPVVVSDTVATTETAVCWIETTPDGNYVYGTNTPDHSISGFSIGGNGSLTLLNANGVTAATGPSSFPIDLDTSRDGEFLYVLLAGTHRIAAYEINPNGSLTPHGSVGGLPGSANGLVAR
jgi:6-phosphogluconolactonase (cycloisomerase 2 family)